MQTDAAINAQFAYKHDWLLGVWFQVERYYFPLLGSAQQDVAGWLQVIYIPRNWAIHK
jgi:hypothetical protein